MSEGPIDPSEQTTLLGVAPRRGALNKFPLWQYLLIAMVVGIGAIYAAPNLFQPDPAVQVRALDSDQRISPRTLSRVEAALKKDNIQIIDSALSEDSLLVRVASDEAQLRAQATIAATLNARDVNYVVALSQASNTPQWLQDIGGTPMSLGLDLFGGAHFLLQVNMQEYLKGVMANSAEGMRDKLIEERIRFLPGKDWVKGQVLSLIHI